MKDENGFWDFLDDVHIIDGMESSKPPDEKEEGCCSAFLGIIIIICIIAFIF